jgi:hypothetical protein
MTSPWMTTQEAAPYARMKPAALARMARLKRIQHGSDGRRYFFLKEHIDAFFMAQGYDGQQEAV